MKIEIELTKAEAKAFLDLSQRVKQGMFEEIAIGKTPEERGKAGRQIEEAVNAIGRQVYRYYKI